MGWVILGGILALGLVIEHWWLGVIFGVLALAIAYGQLRQRQSRARALAAMTPQDREAELARRTEAKRRKENTYKGITVLDGTITADGATWPLSGVKANVETAGEITSRLSATRLAVFGPLGLLARKKVDKRELYLTVEGIGFSTVVKLNPETDGTKARKFAAKINGLAAGAPRGVGHLPVSQDQLRQLVNLRDAGLLTPSEFDTKTAQLIETLRSHPNGGIIET